MKFGTKPIRHYPPHLRHVATLPWAANIEENANKLHFKCDSFNFCTHVTVYAECIYVLTGIFEIFKHTKT